MKIQRVSFVEQGLFFSVKLLGFMSKAIKLLLTEMVSQCWNILPLAFSAYTTKREEQNTNKNVCLTWKTHWYA